MQDAKEGKDLIALKTINAAYDEAIVKGNTEVFDTVVRQAASKIADKNATILSKALEKLEEAKKEFEAFKPDNEATYAEDNKTIVIQASYSKNLSIQRAKALDKYHTLDKVIMECFNLRTKENVTANDVRSVYKKLEDLTR